MILFISLSSHKATLNLNKEGVIQDSLEFEVDNDLSRNLLVRIDELLSRNHIKPLEIEKVEYEAHEAGFTSTRIGQVIANTYNFILEKNTNV